MPISDYDSVKELAVTSSSGNPSVDKAQPVYLVDGSASTTGTGDVEIDFANISDAQDIAVYDQNDNLLDYEIEDLDTNNNTAVLWAYNSWVRDDSTQAKIAYGNNSANTDRQNVTGTWGNSPQNTNLVQHLQDDPITGTDSTNNNNDASNVVSLSSTAGEFDNAAQFGGSGELSIPDSNSLDVTSTYTLVFWINLNNKLDGGTAQDFRIVYKDNAYAFENRSGQSDGSTLANGVFGDRLNTSKNTWNSGTWYQVVWAFDNNNGDWKVYVDGSLDNSKTPSAQPTAETTVFDIGSNESLQVIDGALDEIKLYSDVKDLDWVQAEYDASAKGGKTFFSQQGGSLSDTRNYKLDITTDSSQVNSDETEFPFYFDLSNISDSQFWDNVQQGLKVSNRTTIIQEGSGGSWDDEGVRPTDLVKDPSSGNLWLYYEGNASSSKPFNSGIGIVESTDGGSTWSKKSQNPVLTATSNNFDADGVRQATVVTPDEAEDSQWHMYYAGRDSGSSGDFEIGYATSSDGLSWSKQGTISGITTSDNFSPNVVEYNGTWYLYYSFGGGGDVEIRRVEASSNGTSWSNDTLILAGDNSLAYENETARDPYLQERSDGTWEMWYAGSNNNGNFVLNVATASDPASNSWSRSNANPVTSDSNHGNYPVVARLNNYSSLSTTNDQIFHEDDTLLPNPTHTFQADILGSSGEDTGGSLRVSADSNGNDKLPIELVTISVAQQTGEIHFKDSTDASQNQTFYLWWDAKSGTVSQPSSTDFLGRNAVWTKYDHVLHYQDASGGYVNSTDKSDATQVNGGANTTGQIEQGADFTSNRYAELSDVSDLENNVGGTGTFAISLWYKTSSFDTDHEFSFEDPDGNSIAVAFESGGTQTWRVQDDADSRAEIQTNTSLSTGVWQHLVFIKRGDTEADLELLVDGVSDNSVSSSATLGSVASDFGSPFQLGARDTSNTTFNNPLLMDEARVMLSAPGNGYYQTQYNMQDNNSSFWTIGTVQNIGTTTNSTTADVDTVIELQSSVTAGIDVLFEDQLTTTFATDSNFQAQDLTTTSNIDTLFAIEQITTSDLDSVFQSIDNDVTSVIDSTFITEGLTVTSSVDSQFKGLDKTTTASVDVRIGLVQDETGSLDTVLKALDLSETASLDTIFEDEFSDTAVVDANFQEQGLSTTSNVDTVIQVENTTTGSVDSSFQGNDLQETFEADTVLSKDNEEKTFTADTVFNKDDVPITFDLDTVIADQPQKTASLSATFTRTDTAQLISQVKDDFEYILNQWGEELKLYKGTKRNTYGTIDEQSIDTYDFLAAPKTNRESDRETLQDGLNDTGEIVIYHEEKPVESNQNVTVENDDIIEDETQGYKYRVTQVDDFNVGQTKIYQRSTLKRL